jgi:hypothetical protein
MFRKTRTAVTHFDAWHLAVFLRWRVSRSTGQRADIRGRGDASVMALLLIAPERAKHCEVSDLVTRLRMLPRE